MFRETVPLLEGTNLSLRLLPLGLIDDSVRAQTNGGQHRLTDGGKSRLRHGRTQLCRDILMIILLIT